MTQKEEEQSPVGEESKIPVEPVTVKMFLLGDSAGSLNVGVRATVPIKHGVPVTKVFTNQLLRDMAEELYAKVHGIIASDDGIPLSDTLDLTDVTENVFDPFDEEEPHSCSTGACERISEAEDELDPPDYDKYVEIGSRYVEIGSNDRLVD